LGFAIAAALARDDMALEEATQMAGRLQRHTTMAVVSREFTAAVDAARRGDYEQTEAHAAFVLEQLGGWEQLVLGACVRAALSANARGSVRERYLAEVEDSIEASGLLGLKPMLAEVEAARAGLSSVGSPSG